MTMPLAIATHYWSPVSIFYPNTGEVEEYVKWLKKELAVAEKELELRRPKPEKKFDDAMSKWASLGGKKRASNMTPEKRKEQARHAAKARWAKKSVQELVEVGQ